jgi:predicted nucleic acid-binding protein
MKRAPQEVVICDASVALGWLLEEVVPAWAMRLRERVASGRVEIRVPTLFWLEIGNRLMRRLDVPDAEILEGYVRLEALGLETIEMDRSVRLMAVHLARQHGLSTYDAVYLALATTADLPLATLDGRLADAAAATGRRYGDLPAVRESRGTRETPVRYGTDRPADRVSLAALGAYLAELRDEVSASG